MYYSLYDLFLQYCVLINCIIIIRITGLRCTIPFHDVLVRDEIYFVIKGNKYCHKRIFFVINEINFVLCEKIVANNEIIIFRREITFITNKTVMAIYTLIDYKHAIPTYLPCIYIYCVIAIITIKFARLSCWTKLPYE